MGTAAWCGVCQQFVWVDPSGACVNGHPATALSGHYDTDTGQPVVPPAAVAPAPAPAPVAVASAEPVATPAPQVAAQPAAQPAPQVAAQPAAQPAAAPGTRLGLLADVLGTFAQYPDYTVGYGTDTDVLIHNEIARANWGIGKKKVEYRAMMKAVEAERVLFFWEMLKEEGAGLSFGGVETENTTTFGGKRWGVTKEKIIAPGGTVVDYTWDYAQTRRIVEAIAAKHGFAVKVVLRKKNVTY
jgi:hypothetical protein